MVTSINPSAARAVPEKGRAAAKRKGNIESKPPVGPRFRLLPLTMTMLGLLLVLKTNDIYFTTQELRSLLVANAVAEDKAEAGHADEAKEEGGHGDEKKEEGHGDGKEKEAPKKPEPPKISESEVRALRKLEEQTKYNQIELDLLHNLAKRRDELDAREKELAIKSKVLESTEQRINKRIEEMQAMQAEVKGLIETYKSQQDADVRSLVKIYENMKPASAAAIFNELDMPILLSVIDKMSERKVSPVLAAMSPVKAKEVTEELAELRKAKPVPTSAGTAP